MKTIKRIKNYIKKYEKYQLFKNVSSISFYMMLSLFSITTLLFTFFNQNNKYIKLFLVNDIVTYLVNIYSGLINNVILEIKKTPFQLILIINILYTLSSIFYQLNSFSYQTFNEKRKNNIYTYISSLILVLMLGFTYLFGLVFFFYSDTLLINILGISNKYLLKPIVGLSENIIFYLIFVIIYMYLPPMKVKYKHVKKISMISSLCLYSLLLFFKLLLTVSYTNTSSATLGLAFVLSSYLIFIINFILCFGVIRLKIRLTNITN